jgi:hypothetical protein
MLVQQRSRRCGACRLNDSSTDESDALDAPFALLISSRWKNNGDAVEIGDQSGLLARPNSVLLRRLGCERLRSNANRRLRNRGSYYKTRPTAGGSDKQRCPIQTISGLEKDQRHMQNERE